MANSPVGIYQAEDAELVTGTQSTATRHIQVKSDQNGYEGEGYVDYGDGIDSGETITWTLGSDQAGEFDLAFRYALTTGSRPLLLTVNGGDPITLDFSATGSASTWGTLVQRVTLNESEENVITLTSFENSGANIDQLEVLAVAEPDDGSADEDNNLALIALDSTITGEEAQAVPFQVTGLDDDIETVEISVNDGARRAISLNAEGRFAVDLSGLADGDVTATLFVTDNAGNQATASTAFTLDTGPDDSAYTSPVGVYQAEDAALATGPESTTSNYIRVNDSQAGYEGEGYADYGNGVDRGESITWTIGSDQTGEFDLAFRYALTTGTRPLLLNINGGETVTLDFSATGSATTWDTLTQRVTLAGGQENIITLTSFENSGANIDQLEILPITSAEDTTADKNGDLGLDVLDATIDTTEIAAVPFHITGLDADVKTIAVSFDDGETRLDVTPNNQGDFTLDLTGYEQGKHTATLYVTDEAGNEASTTTSVTIESEEADPGIEPANRFEVKINFQPAIDAAAYNPNFVTPEGYIADEGLAFGQQTVTVGGKVYQYGWVSEDSIADGTANGTTPLSLKDQADLAVNDRTDDIEGLDPLQGTYAHFALPSYAENAGWEMELENGFYEVTLSIGDTSGEYDSHNVINAEGELFNDPFTPFRPDDFPDDSNPADDTEGFRSDLVTRIVEVTDGRLTLDSLGAGSSNTEIQYLEIKGLPDLTPGDERSAPEDYAHFTNPRAVSGVGTNEIAIDLDPDNGAMPTGVGPDSDIFIGVSVVDGRGGTLLESLQDGSVRLFETVTGKEVAFNINTTGGFDSLTISPKDGLKEFTSYTIKIEGFQDRGDNDNPDAPTREFQTFTTTFVTGDAPESVAREVAFTKNIELNGSEDNAYGFTSVELSPDGSKLYIATMAGEIKRYDVDPDTGGLSGEQTLTLDYFQDEDGPRGIIGLTFDPNDASTLWVTDNYPIPLSGRSESVPDFSGRITKITLGDGPEFTATADPYITGLPRSVADHVSNSLEFRVNPDYDAVTNPDVPTHLLYVIQGSDSAMGEPDSAWGSRPERLLNAAVLEIDPTRTPPEGGFDVSTEPLPDNGRRYADDDNDLKNDPIPMGDGEYLVFAENGTATVQNDEGAILEQFYDPYADDAVLKIFATGIRNGYDLVWHSNGQLYVPTNGSAAGGSVPDDPSTSVDESQVNVSKQDDYLFTVEEGGYYGHPNPLHDQYIMNGGNPTSAEDVNQVDDYPVGQEPDPNYRIEDAYSLGENRSPNGATEYTSDVFGSSLQHNLLFTEYSGGDDIRSITLDEDGNIIGDDVLRDINGNVIRYVDSLDIIENPATGQLYLLTLNRNNGQSQLVRLDPAPGGVVTDPTGGDEDDRVSILTIQAEDNTPDDGTSVAIADAEIQIRNENNPESSGLRPGAYGLDGNTNNSDGVMGGYADFGSTNDDFITFTFELTEAQAGESVLQVRYANGGTTSRPLEAVINQESAGTFAFNPPAGITGDAAWSTWQLLDIRADLVAGVNTVTFQATSGTGPNIDQLEVFAVEAPDDSADADNNLALAALDTVLEGDEAETATFQVSGLDDDIETLEVSFNGGERITVVPDDSGQFSLDVSALPDGEVTATLFVTDAAGNEATAATDFTLDTTPGEPVFTTPVGTYQAEDAELGTGPESTSDNYIQEVADQAGYLGDGFVDYGDGIGSGETLTWTIGSDQTGEFDLALRYSLASGTRPLALTVNGGAPITLDFTATGSFSTWQTLTQRVTLIEGQENVITLTSTGSSGPNIDQLEVLAVEASDDSADADNNLALAALDTVLEGDEAETATFQVSGLDDDIETLEVSFNDGERIIVVPDDSGQFSVDVSALPDGEVTATLFVTDAAGNEATAAADFLLDTTPDEPEDPTPGYTEYEAESAELDGGPAVVADPLTSGGSYVDFAGSGDQTVTWTIDVAEAGMYEVGFRYALDSTKDDRPLGLSVNGNTASALNFIGQTNANWDDWYYRTTAVSLDAGSNTITVTAPNANGPNIDSLQVATSPIPTDPGANIALQSDDAGYYADRIHFNYLENNSASSPNRDFKESGSVVVSNTGTAELSILKADLSGPFELADPTIFEDLTLAAGESITVDILFDRDAYTPPATDAGDGVFKGTLQLTTNDADTPIAEMHLAGFWQARDEGGWEPNVNEVWEVFGFGNVIEGLPTVQAGENSVLNDHDLYRPVNDDEVLSRYWKIAEGFNSAKITQLAAFHGSGAAYLGIHNPDNKGQVVQLTNHAGDNNQSLLPIENDGQFATATFYHNTIPDSWKGNDLFSIIVQGLSTDPSLNPTGSGDVPEDAEGIERGYTVRMFQALDANGNAIPNTYLGIMDYTGINYDYNDNMFVIEGIEPASLFEPVAAGDLSIENLDGIPSDDRLVMSRIENPANDSQEVHDEATFSINNNGSADFAVTRLEIADPSLFEIVGDTQNLMVPAGGSLNVTVRFIAEDTNDGSLYESTLLVHANGSETPQAVVQLAGIAQGQSEHGQEPTVQEIVDAFGFSTDVAQEQMNQGGLVEANGDEIIAPYFQRADSSSPIKITQLAAYHTQGDIARLFVHDVGSRDLNEILAHDELDGQTLLPRTLNDGDSLATTTLDRDAPFGFFAGISGRQGYISWSDPDANLYEDSVDAIGNPGTNLNWNADDGHLIRVYIAKDSAGNVIPDTYIVIQDYAGVNYDYNDNIFLVENVQTYDPSGTEDADGNGRVDLYDDNDGDGIPNFQDTEEGTTEQHPHNDTQQPWFVDQDGLTLDAARYDEGGQGIAYNDSSESQLGSNFRGEGVDILGDGDAVGWVTDGEWLEYTLDVAQAGTYNLSFLTALGNQSGGRSITADFTQAGETYASLSPVAIDYSGSWDTYTDSDAIQVELNAGEQVLRLTFNGGSQNLASFELDQAGASGQLPFNADHAPWQVGESLSLDAVLFDEGGQDVAYSDAEAAQLGSDYRQEGVDILDDGTAIGWIRDGEWVEYTLDVEEAGTYDLSFMVATPNAGRSIAASVEQDGSFYENSGPVAVPSSGDWNDFVTTQALELDLQAGEQTLRLSFNGGSMNLQAFTLDREAAFSAMSATDDSETLEAMSGQETDTLPETSNVVELSAPLLGIANAEDSSLLTA
ncbi:hypothetical protein GCM10027040_05460 [Halomonas shantousis]